MREHGVSQVPVVSGEDGRAFMGTVSERGLLMASADHPGILGEPVTEVIEPPLPELDAESPANEAIHMILGRAQAGDRRRGRPRARHPRLGRPDRGAESSERRRASTPGSSTPGLEPDPTYGSVIPPIHQTSTFVQPAPGRVRRGLRLLALGEPDPRGARAGARRARGRPRRRLRQRDGGHPRAADRGARRRRPPDPAARPLRRHLPARRQGPRPLRPRLRPRRPDATSTRCAPRCGPRRG